MDMDPKTNGYVRSHIRLEQQHQDLIKDCRRIVEICKPLAGNRYRMQIAGPARQILNILKPYTDDAPIFPT